MIKRIDIRKINGEWTLMDECPRNWIIEILESTNQIRAIGLSRATEKDPNFYFPLVEGSLFLRNHTFNFYAFFRERAEQQIMDKFDILKVVVLEEDKKVTFYEVEVEAQESIHNHNAWAFQTEDKLAGELAFMSYFKSVYLSALTGKRMEKLMEAVELVYQNNRGYYETEQ